MVFLVIRAANLAKIFQSSKNNSLFCRIVVDIGVITTMSLSFSFLLIEYPCAENFYLRAGANYLRAEKIIHERRGGPLVDKIFAMRDNSSELRLSHGEVGICKTALAESCIS